MAVPYIRYKYSFTSNISELYGLHNWTIIIRDTYLTGDMNTDFKTDGRGFVINYPTIDNDPEDVIIGSRCMIPFIVETVADDGFINLLRQDQEERFFIEILKDSSPFWRGCVIADQLTHENRDTPYLVEIIAIDGLSQLKKDRTLSPPSPGTMVEKIIYFLNKTRTSILFDTTDEILVTNFRWFEDQMPSSVDPFGNMAYYGDGIESEYDNDGEVVLFPFYDIMVKTLTILGCRILMVEGSFHVLQFNNYKNTHLTLFRYAKNYSRSTNPQTATGIIASNVSLGVQKVLDNTRDIATGVYNQEVGATFEYLGALAEVKMSFDFSYQTIYQRIDADFTSLTSTGQTVVSQTDLGLKIYGKTTVICDDTVTTTGYWFDTECEIVVKVGSYYWDGVSWSTTATSFTQLAPQEFQSDEGPSWVVFTHNILTSKPPAQGTLSIQFDPSLVTNPNNSNQTITDVSTDITIDYYNVNNAALPTIVNFTGVNGIATESSLSLDLGESFIGDITALNTTLRRWEVWDGSAFDWSVSWKENASGSSYEINELWVYEIMRNRKLPLAKFDGAIYGDYSPLYSFLYDSDVFVFNGGEIIGGEDKWIGTWLQNNYSTGDVTVSDDQHGQGDRPGDITARIAKNNILSLHGNLALENWTISRLGAEVVGDGSTEVGSITVSAISVDLKDGDEIVLIDDYGRFEVAEVGSDASAGATSITLEAFTPSLTYRVNSNVTVNVNKQGASGGATYVLRAGDTMTGFLTLNAAPTSNLHASTKKYVDDSVAAAGGGDMTTAIYDAASIAEQLVGLTATQTLTNKTLTTPVITNPTGLDKNDVGLSNVDNTSDANKPVSNAQQTEIDTKVDKSGDTMTGLLLLSANPSSSLGAATKQYVDSVQTNLDSHEADNSNPHSVTKSQIGLGNVDNTSDANKPISTAQQTALNLKADKSNVLELDNSTPYTPTGNYHPATKLIVDAVQTNLTGHESNNSNPHSVTKTQIGLSNVDNTSDLNKPISTATQTALDAKVDVSGDTMTGALILHTNTPSTNNEAASKKYVDDSISGGGLGDMLKSVYDAAAISEQLVGITANQTITNKTLNSATINNPSGLDKNDVGLSNVDNTSDLSKPISTSTQSALNLKANTADLATVATTGDYDDLINKPTIPPSAPVDSVNAQTGVVVLDADDIDDSSTAHKFVTSSDLTTLSNTSGTNTGDQDISGIATNAGNISTNTSNISTNASDISTIEAEQITQNAQIATNVLDISTNSTDISALEAEQSTQDTAIGLNTTHRGLTNNPHDTSWNNLDDKPTSFNPASVAAEADPVGPTFTEKRIRAEVVFLIEDTGTCDLPEVSEYTDLDVKYIYMNVSGGTVTLTRQGTDLINGATTYALSNYESAEMILTTGNYLVLKN